MGLNLMRIASAKGTIFLGEKIFKAMKDNVWNKSAVITRAQLAGINGSRKTFELIPSLSHNILVESVGIKAILDEHSKSVVLTSTVKCPSKDDVNTEAMTAVAIAALTVFDMLKKYNLKLHIRDIQLVQGENDGKKTMEVRDYDKTTIKNDEPVVVDHI